MITAVVFSKNRACQLDLLLTSLEKNGRGMFDVHVLYRATTADHQAAYQLCRDRFSDVHFQFDDASPARLAADLLAGADIECFFTDDSVLYRPLLDPFPPTVGEGVLCVSLRLGRNTTWCYPHGREQKLPDFDSPADLLRWNWTRADGDFGYPASVDGHLFRGPSLHSALFNCPSAANPNQMEEYLVKYFKYDERKMMASYEHSCLVGLPLNVVTDTHRNRNAGTWDSDDLAARYLDGWRIDLDALNFTDVRGAHQEIELELKA